MFDLLISTGEVEALEPLGVHAEALVRRACIEGVQRGVRAGVSWARLDHPYRDRTGTLTASIGSLVTTSQAGAEGVIAAEAAHASYIEKGTKPHMIWPKAGEGSKGPTREGQSRRKKGDVGTHRVALRWFEDGSTDPRFARFVRHPGTAPMPFIQPAAEVAREYILAEIDKLGPEIQRLFES